MPFRRLAGALLLALMLLPALPTAVRAHAVLIETTPGDGARLDDAPDEIVLRFNEPVRPVRVQVLGADGAPVTGPDAVTAADRTVRIAVPDGLPSGGYVVSYRVTSIDGHPIGGTIVFGIGTSAAMPVEEASRQAAPGRVVPALTAANRAAHFGALLAAAGGALFLLTVLRRPHPLEHRLRDGLCGLVALAAATAILSVGLGGAALGGLPLASLATAEPWSIGAVTSLGGSAAAGVAGLLLVALGLALRRQGLSAAALLSGMVLAVGSLALTGHAATAAPRWLATPAVLAHGLAVAFWIGALWPLAVALKTLPAGDAGHLVRRFSTLALAAVAVLVAAGTALSILQIGEPGAVLGTAYGRAWVVKLVLVVALLGLAALNRRILTPRLLRRDDPEAPAALRRSIGAELILVAGILAATGLLGQTPPPRALAVAEPVTHAHSAHDAHGAALASGYDATIPAARGGHVAELAVAPARPGRNRFTIVLTRPDGQPLPALEAEIEFALPAAGVEPITRPLAPLDGDGRFAAEIEVPIAGRWQVAVRALVSDFERAIFRAEVPIPPP